MSVSKCPEAEPDEQDDPDESADPDSPPHEVASWWIALNGFLTNTSAKEMLQAKGHDYRERGTGRQRDQTLTGQ
jgi:hypothetical protein